MKFPIQFQDITLRPEITDDYIKIKKFHDPLIDEQVMIGRKEKRSETEWKQNVSHAMDLQARKKGVFLIAENEQQIIGLAAIIQENQKMDHFGNFGIMISKEYRNQGLGTKMYEIVEQWAVETIKGLRAFELGVTHTNLGAISLYQKVGFRPVGILPSKINHFGEYLDEIIMHKWIDPQSQKSAQFILD